MNMRPCAQVTTLEQILQHRVSELYFATFSYSNIDRPAPDNNKGHERGVKKLRLNLISKLTLFSAITQQPRDHRRTGAKSRYSHRSPLENSISN